MSLKHELKLIGKGMLEGLNPKLFLATSLEQTAPRQSKSLIKELRGWSKRQLHIFTERLKMSHDLRLAVYRRYGKRCLYPRCSAVTDIHIDHVVSLYAGGLTVLDNLQPLCGKHNREKGTKTVDYRI